ncbi:hypothetical protein TanjilG_15755 [Lupinus angustifolius]|uniref:B-like cyclin n=1 Tax=Lupinus angustifolius TaxID=3871 RepID=A0A1J7IHJ1_LUPAN|nr:hypothetical protein TanjilG_15755 [Lupinus angustifolius]
MKKENRKVDGEEEDVMRMTRARARMMGGVSASSKPPFKKKEPLTDITNTQSRRGCKNKNTKLAPHLSKQDQQYSSTIPHLLLSLHQPITSPYQDIYIICQKLNSSYGLGIVDIDSEIKDPLLWSSYAIDIYNNIRVTERERRLSSDYMEKLQQDISPGMRAILVDWLVEVRSYNTSVTIILSGWVIGVVGMAISVRLDVVRILAISVRLDAAFLSHHHYHHGKYEEIKAPQVKEFCVITDNAYTKAEVLKMESEVLKLLHFQLSVPTTKTFLRRFIKAAQSSYEVGYVELEFLANYLAELTLVEYSFLQFLPSMIAASAVLLARWNLIQSEHPWNPTMEHYTNYKVSDLKTTVLALADLQLNTNGSSLNAVCEKYKQQKVIRAWLVVRVVVVRLILELTSEEEEEEEEDGICTLYERKLKELNPAIRNLSYDISDLYNFIDGLADMSALVDKKEKKVKLKRTYQKSNGFELFTAQE